MNQLSKTQLAAESLTRDLHSSKVALSRLTDELTQHLADVATGAQDNNRTYEIRQDMEIHHRIITELPAVITELRIREATLREQLQADCRDASLQEHDRLFFELLDNIVAAGSATPAELLQLRKHAAASSNHARKYDIDRLTDALEDHERRCKSAIIHMQDPPPFEFTLEED